mgnify:CR=1 FL=1
MNRFDKPNGGWHSFFLLGASLCSFLLILVLFFGALSSLSHQDALNEKKNLTDALQREISQCYALEGRYPASLSYLTEHYGLTYDHNKYIVDYEFIGSNILPSFHVIER